MISTIGAFTLGISALVDKYGRVFEGRFGGITKPVESSHTGGFNRNTWAVAMIGNFDVAEPTPEQVHSVEMLFGWRLTMDRADPRGTSAALTSAGAPTPTSRMV